MLMMVPGCLWFHIQHICGRNIFPPILAPISPYYPWVTQRKTPFRYGAEYTVTNYNLYQFPSFSLIKSWGFISWRSEMKINKLFLFIYNLVVDLQRGQQDMAQEEPADSCHSSCQLEEVDSSTLAENLQVAAARSLSEPFLASAPSGPFSS